MKKVNPRKVAVQAVMRVHQGGWANLTAKEALAAQGLEGRDKAFAAALFYGTAERLVTLDYILSQHIKKPLAKLDREVRAILETGLYQIIYMDIPARAAVDEAVKLTRSMGKSSAAGFVNAVLRKAGAIPLSGWQFASEQERVQVTWSLSADVAEAVMQAMPEDYEKFLDASFVRKEMCLRVNTLKNSRDELRKELQPRAEDIKDGWLENALYVRLPDGVVEEKNFLAGRYHVQGEASQWVCACVEASPEMKVLDLCAAPGGKSATLAQMMVGGEGLIACDVRANRVPLIQEKLAQLGITAPQVLQNDATVYNKAFEGQDRVLCDVPCSGLGVLATKPDIRYNTKEDFAGLPKVQLEILNTACRYVKEGGRLVYSTCTIRPEENQHVVKAFLQQHPEYTVVLPKELPAGAQVTENMVTILPQYTGLDGFFVATLERL